MNAFEFIASVVDSLAYPAAIIIVVLALRAPIGKLLPELKRFRYGKVEIDFGQEVRKLEDRARTVGLRLPERPVPARMEFRESAQIIDDAVRLAAEFPEPAVGLAWTAVEHEMTQAAARLDLAPDDRRFKAPVRTIALLHERGYLDDDTRGLLDRMRNLRNAAVHLAGGAVRITPDEAREFIALSEAVSGKLKELKA